jgi:hypothetical protein
MSCRLALGTAQFGLQYGVANRSGQLSRAAARAILQQAAEAGIVTLDTAIAYGESEARLGESGVGGWQVVSKLPPAPAGCADVAGWVRGAVHGSLQRLGVSRLHGLLLHEPRELLAAHGSALQGALLALKEAGLVSRIGVSVYGPEELAALWPRMQVDIVQAPFNVIDRRLQESGWLTRLHDAGAEIHVRSVFLQGLLLMPSASRPAAFARWQRLWDQWQSWLTGQQLTALQACLGFALGRCEIDRVIVGVDSVTQLQEIVAAAQTPAVTPPESLRSDDPELLNPSRWRVS